ncbi:alpha/beta fold hydrolase [Actinokineospora iranica]|uniref:Lipase n=1 Tax=Actinokineospora iranica TaxID=1271860 RepID=A0A1G6R289_9PSEU|nr:alpha/beta hydrolase [Actinokineospora iranica]SDC98523.1 lipase [Actinokineospora iranica]
MADPLHVRVFGPDDARPLLALHGVTGHGARFRRLAESGLSGFRVIAPDLRGCGDSPRLPPWTLEQHAADLLAVLDAHRLDAVPVVGHSYGGLIALHLARLAPQRVRRLVLLDPAVSVRAKDALAWAEAPAKVAATRAEAVAAQRADWPDVVADDVIDEEVDAAWAESDGQWRPKFSRAANATAWSEMCRATPLPPPGTPTLLVRALREAFVGPEFIQACESTLADEFTLVGLDNGHMVYLEDPDRIGALVTDFAGA